MSRVAEGETAFPHRRAAYDVVIMPMWSDGAESPNTRDGQTTYGVRFNHSLQVVFT